MKNKYFMFYTCCQTILFVIYLVFMHLKPIYVMPTNLCVPNHVLGDPEVTANTYCKSRNLPNTDSQNYRTDLR